MSVTTGSGGGKRRDRKRETRGPRRQDPNGPLAESAKELGVAVQRGMATVLADVAKTIHEEVDRAQVSRRGPNTRVDDRVRVRGEKQERVEEEEDARDDERRDERRGRR